MKTKIVQFLAQILRLFMKIIYAFMKLKKTKNKKIVFCSRQSSELTLDFQMIIDRLKAEDPDVEIVAICHRIGKGISAAKFMGALLRSMHHMANARVCIIDAYWPAVSMLNHKKDLTVIQLWHAIGKIKKSGYAAVGKKGGRKAEYAKTLHFDLFLPLRMHITKYVFARIIVLASTYTA